MPLHHLLLSIYTDPTIMNIPKTVDHIILDLDILHIQIHTLGFKDIEIYIPTLYVEILLIL